MFLYLNSCTRGLGQINMTKNDNQSIILPVLVALANLALFGLMFMAMNYFELMGADPAYFDDGTVQNLKYINMISGLFGVDIDPGDQQKISTLLWGLCLGLALVSTFFSI